MEELLKLNKHECKTIRSGLMEIASCAERLELALEDANVYEEMGTTARIVSSCYKILSAVINIEEMAKLDDYRAVPFCLSDLVEDVVSVCRSTLRRKGIEIVSEIDRDVCVEADPDRFTSCLMNLIVNALRNVDQDEGVVKVRISRLNGSASVTVSDNGYGADIDEIMEYMNDENSSSGLAVVGKFCREAGTNIIVDDNADGGLIFSFRLPLATRDEETLNSRKSFIQNKSFSPIRVYLAKIDDVSDD